MAGYNDTLASNNVDLQSILNKVNALPEAESGGASVETCTVKIKITHYGGHTELFHIIYTVFENGAVCSKYEYVDGQNGVTTQEITLFNVVCLSAITLVDISSALVNNVSINGTATIIAEEIGIHCSFSAPTDSNEECSIEIS